MPGNVTLFFPAVRDHLIKDFTSPCSFVLPVWQLAAEAVSWQKTPLFPPCASGKCRSIKMQSFEGSVLNSSREGAPLLPWVNSGTLVSARFGLDPLRGLLHRGARAGGRRVGQPSARAMVEIPDLTAFEFCDFWPFEMKNECELCDHLR